MDILSKKIGIIGGGQLGKMMILDAKRLGFYCVTLDPTHDCPSHSISDEHIEAPFDDRKALLKLAESVDVITYEFEHIDAQYLAILEEQGHIIYPSPKALLQIQDKFIQKGMLRDSGIKVPDFIKVNDLADLENYVKDHGSKGMLKARLGGYDGKGNALIRNEAQVTEAFNSLGKGEIPLMIEEFIPFVKEVSVLACRGINGQVSVYPVGENHHKNSILDETIVPARISEEAYKRSIQVAKDVMQVFDGVGMFCVELFVTDEDEVLVNEVAPRPHNSGHYTIEGCLTSQFEQHIRAITGLPFGKSELREPTVMKNLLGEEGHNGKALVTGLKDVYKEIDVKVHLYGKEYTKEFRKMGHLTVCSKSIDEALEKSRKAFDQIKFVSE